MQAMVQIPPPRLFSATSLSARMSKGFFFGNTELLDPPGQVQIWIDLDRVLFSVRRKLILSKPLVRFKQATEGGGQSAQS
jgi:hypothetical protein